MISLPIAYREMLVLARSPLIYRGRITISVLVLLAGTAMGTFYYFLGLRQAAMFLPIAGFFLLLYSLFAGAQATADSISSEKREGTLGLLYLTHMRTGQILFGKLISHSLVVFYGLLTVFPLLSLMLLLGGVDGKGMMKLFFGSMNVLFFSAAIGLFCSSVGQDRKKTAGGATWIILLFWFLPGNLASYLMFRGTTPVWVMEALTAISPAHLFAFLNPMPARAPGSYGLTFVTVHALGWLFLLAAGYNLPRRWQEKAARPGKRTLKERWQQFCYGKEGNRLKRRWKFLNINPIYWLSARNRLKPLVTSLLFLVLLSFFTWLISLNPSDAVEMGTMFTIILMMVQKAVFSGAACARVNEEHEQGTLELLLSTPLSVREVVRGNTLALVWQFRFVLVLIAGLQGLLCAYWLVTESAFAGDALLVTIFGGAVLALHYLDLYTITRFGLWACVTVKNPKQAPQTTVGMIIFFPALIFGMIMATLGVISWLFDWQRIQEVPGWIFFAGYLSLVLINDVFWLVLFRRRFPVKLREFASKRFVVEEKVGLIEKVLRLFRRRKASEPPLLPA